MRIRYVAHLNKPILLDDHWPIPMMGGTFRIVSTPKGAVALEIVFVSQPVSYAPNVEQHSQGEVKASITIRDPLQIFVRMRFESAVSFLQCYFNVDLLLEEIEAEYIAESEEEKDQIALKSWKTGRAETPLSLTYDYFTRALMAAEFSDGPRFEATLVHAARNALIVRKYIDSFRYSFLLIESLYGAGQFKSRQLKDALKGDTDFRSYVDSVLGGQLRLKHASGSDTEKLLAGSPTADEVIDHLVDKRGFYFHGNIQRKDAWKPHEQQHAEAVSLLTLEIAALVSQDAARAMFKPDLSRQHFENAKKAGAIMTLKVDFKFLEPVENMEREDSMNFNVPGTKVTSRMAAHVGREFLERFETGAPTAALKSAICVNQGTGNRVFTMEFHEDGNSVTSPDAN